VVTGKRQSARTRRGPGHVQILNAALVGTTESCAPAHGEVAKRLLAIGAAADTWAPSGLSALMVASSLNKAELMDTLLRGADDSAWRGDAACDSPAGAASANVHIADAMGRTALMHAASHNHVEAVEILLKHGAQVRVFASHACMLRAVASVCSA
jgi:ankyrin repeat protein